MREIDDEVHKHLSDYEEHLNVLRAIGKWHFEKSEFVESFKIHNPSSDISAEEALERLYEFSFLGFYRAGGRGFGGSEYMLKYRESRTRFDNTTIRFRFHPGIIESLGLKRI